MTVTRCCVTEVVMAVLLASLPCLPAAAQCDPVETAKIVPSDGVSGDLFFGDSVAVDGDVAVVGTPQDDTMGADAGAAYVYHHDGSSWTFETKLTAVDGATWNEEARLNASDADADDHFGWAVAVDGDTIFAGAPNNDDTGESSGSAYVFTANCDIFSDGFESSDTGAWSATAP